MSDIRVTRRRGYTVVYNDLLPSDGSLSARAWGVYVYLVGRPDGWECRTGHLRNVFKEGRDALYTALGELTEAGLMQKETYIADGLQRTRYVLDPDAETSPGPDSQEPGNPEPGTPDSGDPHPENPGQVSKEGSSTDVATTERATGDESPAAPKDLNADRDDVDRVCNHLSERLTERQVRHSITKAWRTAARLMMDADGRTEQQVHNMIEWSQHDAFWCSNIHSLPTLREKYDRMKDQAMRSANGSVPSNLYDPPGPHRDEMAGFMDPPPTREST